MKIDMLMVRNSATNAVQWACKVVLTNPSARTEIHLIMGVHTGNEAHGCSELCESKTLSQRLGCGDSVHHHIATFSIQLDECV